MASGDESIAFPFIIPPNTLLINAVGIGSTSLIVWGQTGPARMYTIEVTADIASLQRQIDDLFPGAGLSVTSTGSAVVFSGEVRDEAIVQRAMELAALQGIPAVNNVVAPTPNQILLHVEFAEIAKSAVREVGGDLIRILNPDKLGDAFGSDDTHMIETVSEGFVTLLVEGDGAQLDAVIRALKNTGEFRSLAQPNLVTREGEEASFLAGGEFPFPSVQGGNVGGGATNAVTIQWREFGIKLDFIPNITNSGNIRLHVAPEVSSLDFANGLTISGFNIPSILSRKVETDVELRPGQTLAIGGLLDSTMSKDVDKIPILGDIPILGFFFRSEAARQERTELLVLVTPHILDPNNLPAPPVPTGETEDWDWDAHIRRWIEERSGGATRPTGGTGGS
jgi:pilus assembly protein CpaC